MPDRLEWLSPRASTWCGWWATALARRRGLCPDEAALLFLLPANPRCAPLRPLQRDAPALPLLWRACSPKKAGIQNKGILTASFILKLAVSSSCPSPQSADNRCLVPCHVPSQRLQRFRHCCVRLAGKCFESPTSKGLENYKFNRTCYAGEGGKKQVLLKRTARFSSFWGSA